MIRTGKICCCSTNTSTVKPGKALEPLTKPAGRHLSPSSSRNFIVARRKPAARLKRQHMQIRKAHPENVKPESAAFQNPDRQVNVLFSRSATDSASYRLVATTYTVEPLPDMNAGRPTICGMRFRSVAMAGLSCDRCDRQAIKDQCVQIAGATSHKVCHRDGLRGVSEICVRPKTAGCRVSGRRSNAQRSTVFASDRIGSMISPRPRHTAACRAAQQKIDVASQALRRWHATVRRTFDFPELTTTNQCCCSVTGTTAESGFWRNVFVQYDVGTSRGSG